MNRRGSLAALAAALGLGWTWPFIARAQQQSMPVVGFLGLTSPEAFASLTAAFKQGLTEAGFVEHQSVSIEYR